MFIVCNRMQIALAMYSLLCFTVRFSSYCARRLKCCGNSGHHLCHISQLSRFVYETRPSVHFSTVLIFIKYQPVMHMCLEWVGEYSQLSHQHTEGHFGYIKWYTYQKWNCKDHERVYTHADAREWRLRSTMSRTCVVTWTFSTFGNRAFLGCRIQTMEQSSSVWTVAPRRSVK